MAVAVGGTDGLIDRLLTLLGWKATATVTDQERKDCLFFLNVAEKFIAGYEALLYLNHTWSITVSISATAIDLTAAPFDTVPLDFGKDHVLLDGNGFPLEFCALDRFARLNGFSDSVATAVEGYIISIDGADAKRKIIFNSAQPSNATFKLHGQRTAINLTDDANSKSLLPEGYELTLLLPIAEQYGKQRKRAIDASILDAQTRDALALFYSKQRVNKLTTATDRNAVQRINEKQAALALGDE